VTRYIQRNRLLEAHAVLTDPTTAQSISAISEDLWFAGASSFSRAFKRKFGSSPGDVRLAARGADAPVVANARIIDRIRLRRAASWIVARDTPGTGS